MSIWCDNAENPTDATERCSPNQEIHSQKLGPPEKSRSVDDPPNGVSSLGAMQGRCANEINACNVNRRTVVLRAIHSNL